MSQNARASELDSGAGQQTESDLGLARVSAIMSAGDASDLRKYFASGGFAIFSSSPTGSLIAALKLMAPCRPCEKCGGDPATMTGGLGFVETRRRTRQTTEYERAIALLIDVDLPNDVPSGADKICNACEGRGWVLGSFQNRNKPVTARPTGSSKRGGTGGVSVSEADIALLGRVSARLEGVRRRQGEMPCAAALEAWYSPGGDAEAALWHLTPPGKKLLRDNPQKLPPVQLFANKREEHRAKPNPNWAALFKAATDQSLELYKRSCCLWNIVRAAEADA